MLLVFLTFLSIFLTFGSLDFEKNLIGKYIKNHTQKIKLANKKKIDTKTVSSPWTKYKITAKTIKKIPVDKKVAMTGEVTLRGLVLPIGGLKEKLLAAHRAGIKKVLIPIENKKDLAEVPDSIKKNMEIIAVKNVDEVLKIALTKNLKRVEWVEVEQLPKNKTKEESKAPIN